MKHARRKKGVAREISPPKIESKLDYGPFACAWDLNADINEDQEIGMKDISTIARHFGEHYP